MVFVCAHKTNLFFATKVRRSPSLLFLNGSLVRIDFVYIYAYIMFIIGLHMCVYIGVALLLCGCVSVVF